MKNAEVLAPLTDYSFKVSSIGNNFRVTVNRLIMSTEDQNIHSDGQFDEDAGQQFREMLLNGEIENALALKIANNISDQSVNIHTRDAFDVHKETEQFDIALLTAEIFAFPDGEIHQVKVAEWNRLNRKKQYVEAAEWAKSQSLSEVEIHKSGVSAYENI